MIRKLLTSFLLCSSAFAIVGNFNGDCTVDFKDYAMLAANWQTSGTGDIDSSGTVDLADLYIFSQHWLESEPATAAPSKATTPDPANNATSVAANKTLAWSMANVGCETTLADVWFGESGNMSKVVSDSASSSYSPQMETMHTYQWRIDTKNSQGTTTGDVWTFTTALPAAPVASDGTAAAYTYIVKPIILVATDGGIPNPPGKLRYEITALPADVDAYLQDPVSGGQSRITAANLPYKLSSWGNTVWFATSTVGTTHFHFKVWDGEQYSAEKIVTITTAANLKDCISFDGTGYVTVPDTGNYFDLSASQGIGFCFMTRTPYCGLLKKHETGKAGYEVGLVGGKITINIYSSSGLVCTAKSTYRYDKGLWTNIVFAYDGTNNRIEFYTTTEPLVGTWYTALENWMDTNGFAIPAGTYTNDCNLVIGKNNTATYKYEIDAIRAYTLDMTDGFRSLSPVQRRSTAGNTESYVPMPLARFKCNYDGTNNTTTQIYDDISATHLTGTFNSSSNVRYYPFFWHWYDSGAFQQRTR